jgi:hypothetical protein
MQAVFQYSNILFLQNKIRIIRHMPTENRRFPVRHGGCMKKNRASKGISNFGTPIA